MLNRPNNNLKVSQENLSCILSYHDQFEKLIHDMFMADGWKDTYSCTKRLQVLTYCCYYKFITIDHLIYLDSKSGSEYSAQKTFLYRMVKKGFLVAASVDAGDLEVKTALYTITTKGLHYCMEILQSALPQLQKKYAIDQDCLTYIMNRAKGYIGKASHSHSIGIRDLNAFLFSYLSDTRFRYMIEPSIDTSGQIYSFFERAAGNLVRSVDSIQSDAIFQTTLHGVTGTFYVEQDMNTQRLNVIQKKLSNYIDCVVQPNIDKLGLHNIIFSITSKPSKKASMAADTKEATKADFYYVKTLCFAIHMLSDESTPFEDVPMTDVIEQLEIYCETAPVGLQYYRNVISYVKKIIADDEDMTAEDFLSITQELGKIPFNRTNQFTKKQRRTYLSRRNVLRRSVSDNMERLKSHLLNGLSVYTTHTKYHQYTFPYLLPALSPLMEKKLLFMFSLYGFVPAGTKVSYEALENGDKQTAFKNHYAFENGFHLYVENYSDDIGGRVRIRYYLNHMDWHGHNGVLLCLIDNDELAAVRQMYIKSRYASVNQAAAGADTAFPLRVVFLQYQDLDRGKNLFEFDSDGTQRLMTFSA